MPIYEYGCPDCGHQGEHMQKLADAPLSVCPSCGKTSYSKKISAAGFALKGSGWYVTDFRNGAQKSSGEAAKNKGESTTGDSSSSPQENRGEAATAAAPTPSPSAAPAAAPAASPAPAAAAAPG